MCSVSVITQYGRTMWPDPRWADVIDHLPPQPTPQPDPDLLEKFKKFMELVEKAKIFDRETGQPDCEDPDKARWLKSLEDRIAELERKLQPTG